MARTYAHLTTDTDTRRIRRAETRNRHRLRSDRDARDYRDRLRDPDLAGTGTRH